MLNHHLFSSEPDADSLFIDTDREKLLLIGRDRRLANGRWPTVTRFRHPLHGCHSTNNPNTKEQK